MEEILNNLNADLIIGIMFFFMGLIMTITGVAPTYYVNNNSPKYVRYIGLVILGISVGFILYGLNNLENDIIISS